MKIEKNMHSSMCVLFAVNSNYTLMHRYLLLLKKNYIKLYLDFCNRLYA